MPLLVLAFLVFAILAAIALTPLMLVQRYRLGTARRRARGWVVAINVLGLVCSATLFFVGAAFASFWIPHAFMRSVAGFLGGCLLGLLGVALSRWEFSAGSLYYTPNRWLVLGVTLVVAGRLVFGFWRSWQAWYATPDYASWAAASGAAGSMAAGAVVLGYYLTYWLGVRRRVRRYDQWRTAG